MLDVEHLEGTDEDLGRLTERVRFGFTSKGRRVDRRLTMVREVESYLSGRSTTHGPRTRTRLKTQQILASSNMLSKKETSTLSRQYGLPVTKRTEDGMEHEDTRLMRVRLGFERRAVVKLDIVSDGE